MKRLAGVAFALAVAAASSAASAGELRAPLFPAPAVIGLDGHIAPVAEAGGPVELFHCVKVRDRDHIAPCAEPTVIEIVDPCWKPDPCNPCCKPKCVKVLVCVPKKQTCCDPCACCKDAGPKITCSKDGKHVRHDYGQYAVDVRSKNGYVEVDYDD